MARFAPRPLCVLGAARIREGIIVDAREMQEGGAIARAPFVFEAYRPQNTLRCGQPRKAKTRSFRPRMMRRWSKRPSFRVCSPGSAGGGAEAAVEPSSAVDGSSGLVTVLWAVVADGPG
jgi:hypothetical protein